MHPPQSAGLIQVRKRTFQKLSATSEQLLAPFSCRAALVRIDGGLLGGFVAPLSTGLFWHRYVAPHPRLTQGHQARAAMIPLVGHHFAQPFCMDLVGALSRRCVDLLSHG